MPSPIMTGALRLATDWPNAISANMPPSPLLSARREDDDVLERDDEQKRPQI